MRFGSGDPRTFSGLSPTFLQFQVATGSTVAPPAITEIPTASGIYTFNWGTTTPIAFLADGFTTSLGSGRYVTGQLDPSDRSDEYGTTLVAIGSSNIALGTTLVAIGTSNIALGTTNIAIGFSNIAIGTTNFALGTSNIALGNSNIALGTSNFALGTSIYAQSATIVVTVAGIGGVGSTFGGVSTDPLDIFGYNKRILEILEGNASFNKTSGSWSLYSRGNSSLLRTKTLTNAASGITKS